MSLIDKDLLRQFKRTVPSNPELKNTCMYLNGWNDAIECILHNAKDVDAVDAKFIIELIQSSSGAESAYYSKLLRRWRNNENTAQA